jgi:hypothetical protein
MGFSDFPEAKNTLSKPNFCKAFCKTAKADQLRDYTSPQPLSPSFGSCFPGTSRKSLVSEIGGCKHQVWLSPRKKSSMGAYLNLTQVNSKEGIYLNEKEIK